MLGARRDSVDPESRVRGECVLRATKSYALIEDLLRVYNTPKMFARCARACGGRMGARPSPVKLNSAHSLRSFDRTPSQDLGSEQVRLSRVSKDATRKRNRRSRVNVPWHAGAIPYGSSAELSQCGQPADRARSPPPPPGPTLAWGSVDQQHRRLQQSMWTRRGIRVLPLA